MKTVRAKKGKPKKASTKHRPSKSFERAVLRNRTQNSTNKSPVISSLSALARVLPPTLSIPRTPVFSIDVGSISGETTIGDLIVAFPRTRDVLMKHGLRFDVEQAGYLYMTLGVFSAIHGLTTHNLVQELHVASKEPAPQPAVPQLRPITATTST
ncbi:MAG TPA: hypothetical protein VE955_09670 [Candidatus Dormibacteraeota bacterium]|nr:hypothetical protein [Candidatus Dormibacteraeota bacterium]